jgi:hypothetical protein
MYDTYFVEKYMRLYYQFNIHFKKTLINQI